MAGGNDGRWHICTQATAFSYDGGSIAGAELGFPVACNWKEKQPLLWTSFDIHLTLIFFWHLGLVKMCNIGSKRKIDVPIDCWGWIHSSSPLPWEQEHNQEEADSWQLGQELLAPKEWGPRSRCCWHWERRVLVKLMSKVWNNTCTIVVSLQCGQKHADTPWQKKVIRRFHNVWHT